MLTLQTTDAWIEVDGAPVPEYGVEYDPNSKTVRCWIASEEGKSFAVHWQDEQRRKDTGGLVSVDGRLARSQVMNDPSQRHCIVAEMRVDEKTVASLQFGKMLLTDDDDLALNDETSVKSLGTIRLKLHTGISGAKAVKSKAQKSRSLDQTPVHEKAKKAGCHRITLGATQKKMLSGKTFIVDEEPPLCFIFQYRPKDVLQALEIMPRDPPTTPEVIAKEEEDENNGIDEEEEELKKLEIRLAAMKERVQKRKADGGNSRKAKRPKVEPIAAGSFFKPGEVIDLT